MTLMPPTHILARSIRKGDFIHGRKDQPLIEVIGVSMEANRVMLNLVDGGTLIVYRSDKVRVTLAEFATRE